MQRGLGRTGQLWAVEGWNVEPDILITGKGLSGGRYPVAAAIMSRRVGAWLEENGWAFVSTFGGSEIACVVAARALEICSRENVLASARKMAERLGDGLSTLCERHPFFGGVRQRGLVMGLEFDDPNGALRMSAALYKRGVWAMFAGYARSVLQWKPGLLVDDAYCDELLDRLDPARSDVEAGGCCSVRRSPRLRPRGGWGGLPGARLSLPFDLRRARLGPIEVPQPGGVAQEQRQSPQRQEAFQPVPRRSRRVMDDGLFGAQGAVGAGGFSGIGRPGDDHATRLDPPE